MERPVPRLIRTPTDAEHAAREWMQYWGFVDAFVAGGGGPDGGVDVDSSGAVAQVKAEMRPVSRPIVQQTYGIAAHEGKRAFVFGLSGFTEEATAWGDEAGVGLFGFDLTGEPKPLNTAAFAFVDAASKGEAAAVAGSEPHPRVIIWDPSSPESADPSLVLDQVFAPYADIEGAMQPVMFYGPTSTSDDATRVLQDSWVREVNHRYGPDATRVAEIHRADFDIGDLHVPRFLTDLEAGDTLYFDSLDEFPEHAVEDFVRAINTSLLEVTVGEGPAARRTRAVVPPFFVLGATDNPGRVSDKLRDAFKTWIVRPFTQTDEYL